MRVGPRRKASRLLGAVLVALAGALALSSHPRQTVPSDAASAGASEPPGPPVVTALGRLEPRHGIRRLAGPSRPVAVVDRLLVEEGDRVQAGQIVALLDDEALREADITRAAARLRNAQAELRRHVALYEERVISDAARERLELEMELAGARLRSAHTELERTRVRSPVDGQVIDIHARAGERVGPEGILEIGETDQMYAIAEVYETDVARLRPGQRATVRSPALPLPLQGSIDRIGLKVGKMDQLGTDPAARTDARVVEVDVRLEESPVAAPYSLMQVEVVFEP